MPVTTRTRRILGVASAAALAVSGIALTQGNNAVASTPTSGTITDTSGPVTWTGGPFVVPNTTGTATGTPDCTAPSSCDDFTLHVTTPAGYGDQHKLTIATSWANTAADFDVYVLDAAGNVVGQSASSADPETVVLPPTSGTYDVRVVPFTPLGETYTAKATMTTEAAPPPPGSATPPGFTNYAAPSSLSDSNNAGEPSIGDNWKTGSVMYQAGLSTYKVKFDDSASPATATFTDVSANAASGCPEGSTTSLDPILFTDHATGRTFESQLTGADSFTCTTDDDGATWSPSQGGGIPSGVDHQTIGGGPRSANDAIPNIPDPVTGQVYPRSVYYCSQSIAAAFCAASHNGGRTFGAGVPTYSLLDCGGLHGHLRVAPDGTAYLPNKSCGSDSAVAVSTDGGTSWSVNHVTGTTPGDSDPSVSVGANGTAYFGYVGANGKPGVAVSRDKGAHWTDLQTVGSEFNVQNAVFPTMISGDDDRATLAYIGTTKPGNYQSQTGFKDAVWHLYLSTTYDGGKTWVTSDATPNDPVQRGSICTGGTTCGNDRNLLDFIDITTDSHGRVEVGYADGCINACVTTASHNSDDGPADAQAAYATIARQSSGLTLFSAYDPAPVNLKLARQKVHKSANGSMWVDRVTVSNTGSKATPSFRTAVTDNGKRVGGGAQTTSLAPHSSKVLVFRWARTTKPQTIVASTDPRDRVSEKNEGDNKRVTHRGSK